MPVAAFAAGRAPVIGTRRLLLAPLAEDDAAEMAVVLGDPALHQFIGGSPADEAGLHARYRTWARGSGHDGEIWLNWAVRLRDTGRATGHLQATVTTAPPGPAAEVAWVIGTPWQGRGLAAEAAVALVSWLTAWGVRDIRACILPGNRASERVAQRAGLALTSDISDGERVWRRLAGGVTSPVEPFA